MRQKEFFILETNNSKFERGVLRLNEEKDVLQYIHDISVNNSGETIEAIRKYEYGGIVKTFRVEFKGKLKLVREIPDKYADSRPVDNTKHDKSMSNRGKYSDVALEVEDITEVASK